MLCHSRMANQAAPSEAELLSAPHVRLRLMVLVNKIALEIPNAAVAILLFALYQEERRAMFFRVDAWV